MNLITGISMLALFVLGAFLIGQDGATSVSNAGILSWIGFGLGLAGLFLIPIISVIDKFKKK